VKFLNRTSSLNSKSLIILEFLLFKYSLTHIDRRYFFLTIFLKLQKQHLYRLTQQHQIPPSNSTSTLVTSWTTTDVQERTGWGMRPWHAPKRHASDERSVETWKLKRKTEAHECRHSNWSACGILTIPLVHNQHNLLYEHVECNGNAWFPIYEHVILYRMKFVGRVNQ